MSESGPSAGESADDDLIRRSRAGSVEAYDALVRRYHGKVFGFLLALTKQRQDAEDLTQDTFVRAWRKIDRFDPRRPLLPWLLTIARRLSIAMLRRRKPVPGIAFETAVPPPEPGGSGIWQVAERKLSRDAFSALWLHYHDDMPLAEVGRVLGKREGAVKVMLHRARKTLAAHLQTPGCDASRAPVAMPAPTLISETHARPRS